MAKVKIGEKYGRWTVLALGRLGKRCRSAAYCRCECGVEKWQLCWNLQSEQTKSCGCGVRTMSDKPGLSSKRLYACWNGMMDRCYNVKSKDYPRYGGRGIVVCERWHSLSKFLDDMAKTFKEGLTLDRKLNDGPYSPENCRWATINEQNVNRGDNVFVEANGQRLTCADWARKLGVSRCVIRARIRSGWDLQAAVTTPKLVNNKIRNSPRNRWIEFQGLRLTLADWARRLGIKPHTLAARLRFGMSIEKALTKGLLT